jgi:hypothetical protein
LDSARRRRVARPVAPSSGVLLWLPGPGDGQIRGLPEVRPDAARPWILGVRGFAPCDKCCIAESDAMANVPTKPPGRQDTPETGRHGRPPWIPRWAAGATRSTSSARRVSRTPSIPGGAPRRPAAARVSASGNVAKCPLRTAASGAALAKDTDRRPRPRLLAYEKCGFAAEVRYMLRILIR